MALEDEVKAVLVADTVTRTTATGGIYVYEQLGRLGINRTITPDLFDADGLLRPNIIIQGREEQRVDAIVDPIQNEQSMRMVLEIYLYDDSDSGYVNIDILRNRVFNLLNLQSVNNTYLRYLRTLRRQREFALDMACFERCEFEADYIQS